VLLLLERIAHQWACAARPTKRTSAAIMTLIVVGLYMPATVGGLITQAIWLAQPCWP
jgi:hypothetical protein